MYLKFSHLNVTSSTYSTFVRSAIFACYSSSISPRPFRMDKILWLLKLAILLLHSQWFRCKVIRERGDQSTSADANGALSYILELGGLDSTVEAGGWQMVHILLQPELFLYSLKPTRPFHKCFDKKPNAADAWWFGKCLFGDVSAGVAATAGKGLATPGNSAAAHVGGCKTVQTYSLPPGRGQPPAPGGPHVRRKSLLKSLGGRITVLSIIPESTFVFEKSRTH